jgi:hypothetical protein
MRRDTRGRSRTHAAPAPTVRTSVDAPGRHGELLRISRSACQTRAKPEGPHEAAADTLGPRRHRHLHRCPRSSPHEPRDPLPKLTVCQLSDQVSDNRTGRPRRKSDDDGRCHPRRPAASLGDQPDAVASGRRGQGFHTRPPCLAGPPPAVSSRPVGSATGAAARPVHQAQLGHQLCDGFLHTRLHFVHSRSAAGVKPRPRLLPRRSSRYAPARAAHTALPKSNSSSKPTTLSDLSSVSPVSSLNTRWPTS